MVKPGGLLLLASVLPFNGRVYEGKVGSPWARARWRKPRAPLEVSQLNNQLDPHADVSFESAAVALLDAILRRQPLLELSSWSRLPYMSSADTVQTHHMIDMALMVLRLPAG